jgi:curved DNA-binding protein CbpA
MAFDPYETWLNIQDDRRPPNNYDLLGLPLFESDPVTIEQAALRRMGTVRLYQLGPHSDLSQEILAELARARLVLSDPERRADYDAMLRAGGEARPAPALFSELVGSSQAPDPEPAPEPETEVPGILGSLDLSVQESGERLSPRAGSNKRRGGWKRVALILFFLATHALLFGAFYFYVFRPANLHWIDPAQVENDSSRPDPAPERSPETVDHFDSHEKRRPFGVEQEGGDPGGNNGSGDPRPDDRPAGTDRAESKRAIDATPKLSSASAPREFGGTPQKPGSRVGQVQHSAPLISVKPVFFVPRGEPAPAQALAVRLSDHLTWCHERYGEMLRGRDNFTLESGPAIVHRSRTSLAQLKAAPEMGAPRIAGELLDATRTDRFSCAVVFVVVVMNAHDNFPAGGGRPFNGGYNTGGGIVVLSSFALGKLPNFQSTLQHELGHAFGLPHIDVYGKDLMTSESIMSYDPSHHTSGMLPSRTPGTLATEDLRGLSLNRRAFPKLALERAQVVSPGVAPTKVVPLGPMAIDGQPAYEVTLSTKSGQTFGTHVSNIVQNRIMPNVGGTFRSNAMWQSAPSADGSADVLVTFPVAVTLTAVGVHSQHSGLYNAANSVRVEAYTKSGFRAVGESAMHATELLLPLPEPASAKIWRITFHAANKKEVTLRGLQFFTKNGELFPPSVPGDDDVGFLR